jgi:hypothetical protein
MRQLIERPFLCIGLLAMIFIGAWSIQLAQLNPLVACSLVIAIVFTLVSLALTLFRTKVSEPSGREKIALAAIAALVSIASFKIPPIAVFQLLMPGLSWLGISPSIIEFLHSILLKAAENNDGPAVSVVLAIALIGCIAIWPNRENLGLNKKTFMSPKDLTALRDSIFLQLHRLDDDATLSVKKAAFIPPSLSHSSWNAMGFRQVRLERILKNAKPNSFVVIKGEPGSGKSLALRRVAKIFAKRMSATNKIPFYLNLRDLELPRGASQSQFDSLFYDWVKSSSAAQINACLAKLFDRISFDKLYAGGHLLFFFDSFDEIPVVVGAHHSSRTVTAVSSSIAAFIKASGGCTAVVASREYKSPSFGPLVAATYTLPPFSDRNVRRFLQQSGARASGLMECIFNERPDLYSISRNPFLLTLLVDFYETNRCAPDSEYHLYEAFVQAKLKAALDEENYHPDKFNSALESGMLLAEQALDQGRISIPEEQATSEGLEILKQARILRVSGGMMRFAHRRLLEYFRVRSLLREGKARPKLAAGYLDQHYDVLVLYGSVCGNRAAKSLAAEAIRQIKSGSHKFHAERSNTGYERMLLALRFFRDAFRSREKIKYFYVDELHITIVRM